MMKPNRILLSIAAFAGISLMLSHCNAVSSGGGSGSLSPATKDQPFVNSLGMKFVPVPGTKILMCTTETTVAQYQAAGMGYQAPKFPQGPTHPAVNVSWNDARAWCQWLSKKEGRRYRLPMDLEWSAAVGPTKYPWGNQWPPPSNFGNYAGQEMRSLPEGERAMLFAGTEFKVIGGFSDQHRFTAPVGSYPPNTLGICDLGGNAWERCGERNRTRGGSWNCAYRASVESAGINYWNNDNTGFRCVIER